jgi:hypothetical protein
MIRHITLQFKSEDELDRRHNAWALGILEQFPNLERVGIYISDMAKAWEKFLIERWEEELREVRRLYGENCW